MGIRKSAPVITEPAPVTPERLTEDIEAAYRRAAEYVSSFIVARDGLLAQAEKADAVAEQAEYQIASYQQVLYSAQADAEQFRLQAEKIAQAVGLDAHPANGVEAPAAEHVAEAWAGV